MRTRRFSGIAAAYMLNIAVLAMPYTFAVTLDSQAISHTDATHSALYVYVDSLYDLTLVAGGLGFGHRVAVGWFAKLTIFVATAYVAVFLTMTVYATILSSVAMYGSQQPQQRSLV